MELLLEKRIITAGKEGKWFCNSVCCPGHTVLLTGQALSLWTGKDHVSDVAF